MSTLAESEAGVDTLPAPPQMSRVFTLDSDFGIYRLERARRVPLIAPF